MYKCRWCPEKFDSDTKRAVHHSLYLRMGWHKMDLNESRQVLREEEKADA